MTTLQLRGGFTTVDPRTDRLPERDERSRQFQVREILEQAGHRDAKGKFWTPGPTLDQLGEGQCVSETIHDERNGTPNRTEPAVTLFTERRRVYHELQHADPWDGCYLGAQCAVDPDPANAYGGTSVLTGMKYGRDHGWWREFRWVGAGSGRLEDDIIDSLRALSGICFGIPWLDSMYETNPEGLISIDGIEVGGHAIRGWEWIPRLRLPKSFRGSKPAVALHNSWGDDYGVKRRGVTGTGFILLDDLLQLMERGGEGAVVLP